MIFYLERAYAGELSAQERSELYCDIITHGHYADCEDDVRQSFYADIETHGSSIQRSMAKKDPSLKLTARMRSFLTTINASNFSEAQLKVLTCQPARLMVENEAYERPVYERMIDTYAKSDRTYRNIFIKLNKALTEEMLTFQHGGGHGTYVSLLTTFNQREYRDVADWKFCSLVDRDTDNSNDYDSNKDSFFRYMCGQDSTTLSMADVYSLTQRPHIWHMWYRRAIENYFPDKQFMAIRANLKTMPLVPADRNYKALGTMSGYSKHKLPQLALNMSYGDYEQGLARFQTPVGEASELQLFLLKLVRII